MPLLPRHHLAGDFGEEVVPLVSTISRVQGQLGGNTSVGVILGNHDAWYSMFGSAV